MDKTAHQTVKPVAMLVEMKKL